MKRKIMISFDKAILNRVDDYLEKIGLGANRSAFINEAVDYYLKLRGGIPQFMKKD